MLAIINVLLTSNTPVDSVGDSDGMVFDEVGVALNRVGFKDIVLGDFVG